MYSINGDFGKVRHIPLPPGYQSFSMSEVPAPYLIASGGWHRCNDQYRIQRAAENASQHLLLFSVSEGGRMQIGNGPVLSLPASSAAWIPFGYKHCYFTASGGQWEFYWLHLLDSPALMLSQLFPDTYQLPISHMDIVCQEMEALLHNREKNPRKFQIESSRRFSSLYHILLGSNHPVSNPKQGDSIVLDIIQHMEADLSRDWNLPLLSAQHYLSVPQLIRRFKTETGLTPHSYLIYLRLQAAERYLNYTSMSVEQISQQVGFASVSNFIMQFGRSYGCSPQKYRENR